MIVIKEIVQDKESRFEKYISEEVDHYQLLTSVCYKGVKIKSSDNMDCYFLIYDSNYDVEPCSFEYLNYFLENQSVNTREQASVALKLLFSFCELLQVDYKNLGISDIQNLIFFLKGRSNVGVNIELKLISKRNPNTINIYIGVYRKFLKFLGIDKSPLFSKTIVFSDKQTTGFLAHTKRDLLEKYSANVRTTPKQKLVPKYIREFEFKRVLGVIRRDYTEREEIIIRLMFECGMRIGEILGLTLEDINYNPSQKEYEKDGMPLGEIHIRNRISDNADQLAKTCFTPRCKEDYENKLEYQIVRPSFNLILKIESYIEKIHGKMSKIKRENYLRLARADKVTNTNQLERDNNYYIFLNKNGTPLRQSGWNDRLREIFVKAGLSTDKINKKNNLNHRFRHGFAMFLKKNLNATPLDLMGALRHSNLSSVAYYFNPTEEDLYEANEKTMISIHKAIPELRE